MSIFPAKIVLAIDGSQEAGLGGGGGGESAHKKRP
jgi:hypothetical protein